MKLYLAGPLFTAPERVWNFHLAACLRNMGYSVFLPQEKAEESMSPAQIFEADLDAICEADAVVAILDGPDPDSGTSFEVGYSFACETPVIGIRTDFRGRSCAAAEAGNFTESVNLMLVEGCTDMIWVDPDISIPELARLIHESLREAAPQHFADLREVEPTGWVRTSDDDQVLRVVPGASVDPELHPIDEEQ